MDPLALLAFLFIAGVIGFFLSIVPIPVGYKRGQVAWMMWCGTGMHPHVVYWTDEYGFQTRHPAGERVR